MMDKLIAITSKFMVSISNSMGRNLTYYSLNQDRKPNSYPINNRRGFAANHRRQAKKRRKAK